MPVSVWALIVLIVIAAAGLTVWALPTFGPEAALVPLGLSLVLLVLRRRLERK